MDDAVSSSFPMPYYEQMGCLSIVEFNVHFICMPCEVLMIGWMIARSQTIWTLLFEFNLD